MITFCSARVCNFVQNQNHTIKSDSRKKYSVTLVGLKEYFYENNSEKDESMQESDNYTQLPFFNKGQSTFVPPNGHDTYLDFYIEAVRQEILQASPKRKLYSNNSKEEMESLRSLSQDDSIVIKKS